ncbi:MAG: P1 family peptidase [Thermomicrobiales bacterium]
MSMHTNDTANLTPRTAWDGPSLTFDFPAFQIGIAEYSEGPTGCTVFHFPAGAACAVDVRGGVPGFLGDYGWVDAICLAGGSLYGLEAATGVAAELFALRGYRANWMEVALVSGAIIFDYGPRENTIYPDKALGRAALKAARAGIFPFGGHGAGCSARVGGGFDRDQGELAGQGGAFRQVGETKLAVFSVVNAVGAIVDRGGNVVRGHRDRATGRRHHLIADLERRLAAGERATPSDGNTTLTVVVVNQKLDMPSLRQVGRQVHSSMARAIQPFHTMNDGDVLFTVTTGEVENAALSVTAVGLLASELAWDAILTSFAGRGTASP